MAGETKCTNCGARIVTGESLCGDCKRGTDKLLADIKKEPPKDEDKD